MNIHITTALCLLGSALLASAEIQLRDVRPVETTTILARDCEQGKTIQVLVSIDADGSVIDASATDADPYDALLAQRVVEAVKAWKFSPAKDGSGQACKVTVLLPVHIQAIKRG